MDDEDRKKITIRSAMDDEFNTAVILDGKKHLVVTENEGAEKPRVITRVYLSGKIVHTKRVEVERAAKAARNLNEFMRNEHQMVINALKKESAPKAEDPRETESPAVAKSPAEYLREAKSLILGKDHQGALCILNEALRKHPEDPFVLSYYGSMKAVVGKDYEGGIGYCRKAFSRLLRTVPFGADFYYPTFFLNLGKAYLAAGRRKDAIHIFRKGLSIDKENPYLIVEMKRLGTRKKRPLPMFKRSNPLNKYLGIMRYRLNGASSPTAMLCI